MPRTVVQGGSFKYWRDQAQKMVPVGAGAGGDQPPPGFQFLLGQDGQQLLGADGQQLYGAA